MSDGLWLAAVRAVFAEELSAAGELWRDVDGALLGPRGQLLHVEQQHASGPRHVDLGYCVNRTVADPLVFWDCASWHGEDRHAAEVVWAVWSRTALPAIREGFTLDGSHAVHAHGDGRLGLGDWHSIHGPLLSYAGVETTTLRDWCAHRSVVPMLAPTLGPALAPGRSHGVKFFLGALGQDSIAEVRIDGVRDDASSGALLALPWPRDERCIVRFYVIFLHTIDRQD